MSCGDEGRKEKGEKEGVEGVEGVVVMVVVAIVVGFFLNIRNQGYPSRSPFRAFQGRLRGQTSLAFRSQKG